MRNQTENLDRVLLTDKSITPETMVVIIKAALCDIEHAFNKGYSSGYNDALDEFAEFCE